jgi:hypothetical protein
LLNNESRNVGKKRAKLVHKIVSFRIALDRGHVEINWSLGIRVDTRKSTQRKLFILRPWVEIQILRLLSVGAPDWSTDRVRTIP